MSKAVIDTSVLLALLWKEPISPEAYSILLGGYVSTVSVAEVYSKLAKRNMTDMSDLQILFACLQQIVPLSLTQAAIAGQLLSKTASGGLSLGDRCCLALAIEMGGEAYTCDRAWANLNPGCKVHLVR